jgi:hypothetical protein
VPEELAPAIDDSERIGDRMVRVEALVNSLTQRVVGDSAPSDEASSTTSRHQQGNLTPSLTDGPLEVHTDHVSLHLTSKQLTN